jgi:hypothetical protein
LSGLRPAWHQGQLPMDRTRLVEALTDLFVRIDGIRRSVPTG